MKYFIDTEFHEYQKNGIDTIELISLGMVREDGTRLYLVSKEFDIEAASRNPWLMRHVLCPIAETVHNAHNPGSLASAFNKIGFTREGIKDQIRLFIGKDEPQFYGYYADYDWVVFCWIFGRMIDLPSGYPMYCRDLKQMLDEWCEKTGIPIETVRAMGNYPQLVNEHTAIDDAMWNLELYKFLVSLQKIERLV